MLNGPYRAGALQGLPPRPIPLTSFLYECFTTVSVELWDTWFHMNVQPTKRGEETLNLPKDIDSIDEERRRGDLPLLWQTDARTPFGVKREMSQKHRKKA